MIVHHTFTLERGQSERGAVIVIFAVFAMLLVILTVGFGFTVPIAHMTAQRAQRAVDEAALAGLEAVLDPDSAISHGRASALGYLRDDLSAAGSSLLLGMSRDSTPLRLLVPGSEYSGRGRESFSWSKCTLGGSCGAMSVGSASSDDYFARYQSALSVFDPAGSNIDDFKNAVTVFGRFEPWNFLPSIAENVSVEVVSSVMLRTALTYVLVDPTFPIEENYRHIYGEFPCGQGGANPDASMWPVATPRNPDPPGMGAWSWPNSPGIMKLMPSTGAVRPNPASDQCIYQFYASMCDTLPFYRFKEGIVGLLDRMAHSSAYNSTTLVGLTGYRVMPGGTSHYTDVDALPPIDLPLVPIHPKFAVAPVGVDCPDPVAGHFPDGGQAFPLQIHGGGENEGLHSRKLTAYNGMVNSYKAALNANRRADCGGSTNPVRGTGLNRWELCLCRGLYNDPIGGPDEFLLADDRSPQDVALFSHAARAARVRAPGYLNWCDDTLSGTGDVVVNLEGSASGGAGSNQGETARNLISSLAIRMDNPYVYHANNDQDNGVDSWWIPPSEGTTAKTGWRDLGHSLNAAIDATLRAANEYQSDARFGTLRPVTFDSRAIAVFGFGPWSRTTVEALSDGMGGNISAALSQLATELRAALHRAVCENKIKLVITQFALNTDDRASIEVLNRFIAQLQKIYSDRVSGQVTDPATVPEFNSAACLDLDNPIPNTHLFVYDPQDARFGGGPQGTLNAMKSFADETPSRVMRLLTRFDYRI